MVAVRGVQRLLPYCKPGPASSTSAASAPTAGRRSTLPRSYPCVTSPSIPTLHARSRRRTCSDPRTASSFLSIGTSSTSAWTSGLQGPALSLPAILNGYDLGAPTAEERRHTKEGSREEEPTVLARESSDRNSARLCRTSAPPLLAHHSINPSVCMCKCVAGAVCRRTKVENAAR